LVGGFLGAGKTTLLLRAASVLKQHGLRAAILTNDQAGDLVDTHLASAAGFDCGEVASGCFCCHFSEFLFSARRLLAANPDVLLAEPVGSCVDLVQTVLQPLARLESASFSLAPFTVLVDPVRAKELLSPEADPDLAYLFHNQLAEADFVYYTRADLGGHLPDLPGGVAGSLSGTTGEGVGAWINMVLSAAQPAPRAALRVDYTRYAEAEAALGWLNWHARLSTSEALTPATVLVPLVRGLGVRLTEARARIVHLKAVNQTSAGLVRAALCRNGDEPQVDGAIDAAPVTRHELTLNLRAIAAPELLSSIVDDCARRFSGELTVLNAQSFRPAAPVPEHPPCGC
jgi:hypothetical protein